MNCSTPGLPVHHQLPAFTQTHVHRVSDAITSWQIEGENVKVVTDFLFLGSKITVTVTEAMNSEDDCFLEGKL